MDDLIRSLLKAFPESSVDDLLKNIMRILEELAKFIFEKVLDNILPSIPGIGWLILVTVVVLVWYTNKN
jgi:hypothetical protein